MKTNLVIFSFIFFFMFSLNGQIENEKKISLTKEELEFANEKEKYKINGDKFEWVEFVKYEDSDSIPFRLLYRETKNSSKIEGKLYLGSDVFDIYGAIIFGEGNRASLWSEGLKGMIYWKGKPFLELKEENEVENVTIGSNNLHIIEINLLEKKYHYDIIPIAPKHTSKSVWGNEKIEGGKGIGVGNDDNEQPPGLGQGNETVRIRISEPNIENIESDLNCKIQLRLKVDAEGNVISAKSTNRTTTQNQELISQVIEATIKTCKYKKKLDVKLEDVYITINIEGK